MNSGQSARICTVILVATLACALPALAGTRIEKQLELAPGGEFVLDTDMGSVVVRGAASGGARVVITSKRDDLESQVNLAFDESPGRVEVRLDRKSKVSSWFKRNPGVKFEIEIPRDTRLSVDTSGGSISVEAIEGPSRLDTSGGSIEVIDHGGELTVDTSGGSITVEQAQGKVTADTSGGSIRMEQVAGDIVAQTSGGSIRIKEAGGHVVAETSGGAVEVLFSAGNGLGGKLSTSGGGVTAHVDPSVGLDVDASTSGGSVVLDVPLTVQGKISRTAIRGTLGDGGAMLTLRSSGGSIRVGSR